MSSGKASPGSGALYFPADLRLLRRTFRKILTMSIPGGGGFHVAVRCTVRTGKSFTSDGGVSKNARNLCFFLRRFKKFYKH